MLEIKKDGFFFDMYPGTIISMEINNPVMDDDIVKGNYSFPFKMPLTPGNKALLHFPDEIANMASLQVTATVEVWVDGLLVFPAAAMKIKDVTSSMINVFILVGISTFAEYADATKVADKMNYKHSFASTTDGSDMKAFAKITLSGTVDTFPIVFFPVQNSGHYQNQAMNFSGSFTKEPTYNVYADNDFQVSEYIVITDQISELHGNRTMVPFIYVTHIMRRIFENHLVTDNVFETDPELKKLTLFNNFNLDHWLDFSNSRDRVYRNVNDRTIDLKNHVPDMKVGELIVALKKVFCLFFYKDPFTDKLYFDAFKNVINSQEYTDWSQIAASDYNLEENSPKGLKYLPDVKSEKVLEGTGSMLNVARKPAVDREYNLPGTGNMIGDVRMVEETGMLYTWQNVLLFNTWIPYTNAFGDYYTQPAGYEIKNSMPAAVPSKLKYFPSQNYSAADEWLIPAVNAAGSYMNHNNVQISTPVINKLLFYRGLQMSQGGRNYPLGSSHNYNYQKNKVGNYSLAWDGADGLYNKWWKEYLQMKDSTKEVSRQVVLNMPALLSLDLRKKVRIGSNNFLIKKISLQLPLTKPAKVELWKVD